MDSDPCHVAYLDDAWRVCETHGRCWRAILPWKVFSHLKKVHMRLAGYDISLEDINIHSYDVYMNNVGIPKEQFPAVNPAELFKLMDDDESGDATTKNKPLNDLMIKWGVIRDNKNV